MNIKITEQFAARKVGDRGFVDGVSVITMGAARGHPMHIDEQTLADVERLGNGAAGGIKVGVDHGSGFDGIIGFLKNFRTSGNKVLADLRLLASHPSFQRVLDIVNSIPTQIGLSISFGGKLVESGGKRVARVEELYSVDLVDSPAANPSGLFSAALAAKVKASLSIERARRITSELFGTVSFNADWPELEQEFLRNGHRCPWTGAEGHPVAVQHNLHGRGLTISAWRKEQIKRFFPDD